MATLGSCATILQLAFGVNAILPTISVAFRTAQRNVARKIGDRISLLVPDHPIAAADLPYFADFLTTEAMGLAVAERVRWAPAAAFISAIVISFFGLILAATSPDLPVPNAIVWFFAIYSLAISPGIGLAYRTHLAFFEEEIEKLWGKDQKGLRRLAESFERFKIVRKQNEKVEERLNDPDYLEQQLELLKIRARQTFWGRVAVRFLDWLQGE